MRSNQLLCFFVLSFFRVFLILFWIHWGCLLDERNSHRLAYRRPALAVAC